MKTLLILAVFLPVLSWSSTFNEICVPIAESFGLDGSLNTFPQTCEEQIQNLAQSAATATTENGDFSVFGLHNMLFSTQLLEDSNGNTIQESGFIAGERSTLYDVLALKLYNGMIYVLNLKSNGTKNIISFNQNFRGVLVPKTQIEDEVLQDVFNLIPVEDKVFAIAEDAIYMFNANAREGSALPANDDSVLNTFHGLNFSNVVSIEIIDTNQIKIFRDNGEETVLHASGEN